jgi:ribosomal protein L28
MFCFHCGKGILIGRSHTHHRGVAGGRWKKRAPKTRRIFEPNLQPTIIMIGDVEKRVKLCTKCIKRVKKDMNEGVTPFVHIVNYKPTVAVEVEASATASA